MLSAKLTLPRIATNKSWYCVWIMVAEMKGSFEYPAMVQGGLMRWDEGHYALRPFVAVEHSGYELEQTNGLPTLSESPEEHEFAISRVGNRVEILMDGKAIFDDYWHAYFRDDEKIYAKIAAEVAERGDRISGGVREIALTIPLKTYAAMPLTTPLTTYVPAHPFQAAEDRGLKFVCKNEEYTAVGTFDPRLPFRWVDFHSCESLGHEGGVKPEPLWLGFHW